MLSLPLKMMTAQHLIHTPLGWMLLLGNEEYIQRSFWLENDEDAVIGNGLATAGWKAEATHQIEDYFNGKRRSFALPLEPLGTPFQQSVWKLLLEIPYGNTLTYAQVSERCGPQAHPRPVGAAIGANPLLLLIPCHRVRGSDGTLTGYAGGLDKKEWLLRHEGSLITQQLRLF